ncbi:MAG TPA: riboflavin synthase [Candidatus Kapabacteria bacterium]|nr:riboflavin synthase [Candidatus Kapabacteria bacterium]
MFTGIIEELGTVIAIKQLGTSRRIEISAEKVLQELKVDDSIAVNGVCQTVVEMLSSSFEVISVAETLSKTTLSSLTVGEKVNLERAATPLTRLGGHLVAGHIDGVAVVETIVPLDGSSEVYIRLPKQFVRYVIARGSIAVNGVSLTVAEKEGDLIKIAIIPHTSELTTFGRLHEGDKVNIELDQIAKMVEQLLLAR